jgi:hypothetical protein
VNVCAQPRVIRQIVAGVVWIVIDHDVVIVPKPVISVCVVIRRKLKEIAAYIESIRAPSTKSPDVLRADATAEAPVFPRTV